LDPKNHGKIDNTSTSAVVALALHDQVLTMAGDVGAVQSMLFPVRFHDYSKEYLDEVFEPYLAGPDAVHMILVLGENSHVERMDLECFAAKAVNGTMDNVGKKGSKGAFGRDKFLETRLPVGDMVDPLSNPRIWFDQSYESSAGSQNHPADGGPNTTVLPGVLPTGNPIQGSGGSFLYNQVFYTVLRARKSAGSNVPAGLISLPKPGATWSTLTAITTAVEDAIKRSLDTI
jgi:pyrrolidone-carboxylate peptidase